MQKDQNSFGKYTRFSFSNFSSNKLNLYEYLIDFNKGLFQKYISYPVKHFF